jgi:hypothetical protein
MMADDRFGEMVDELKSIFLTFFRVELDRMTVSERNGTDVL